MLLGTRGLRHCLTPSSARVWGSVKGKQRRACLTTPFLDTFLCTCVGECKRMYTLVTACVKRKHCRACLTTPFSDTFLCTCVGKCQGKTKMSVPDHTIFGHLPLHVSTHTYVCACLYLSNVNTLAVFIVAHNSVFIRTQCLCLSNITHTHTEHTQTHTHMGQVVMPFSSH